jgi:hypothetical protein
VSSSIGKQEIVLRGFKARQDTAGRPEALHSNAEDRHGATVLLGGEFVGGFGEDFAMKVDVGLGGGRAHEGHIVKWCEEDAAI